MYRKRKKTRLDYVIEIPNVYDVKQNVLILAVMYFEYNVGIKKKNKGFTLTFRK